MFGQMVTLAVDVASRLALEGREEGVCRSSHEVPPKLRMQFDKLDVNNRRPPRKDVLCHYVVFGRTAFSQHVLMAQFSITMDVERPQQITRHALSGHLARRGI